MTLPIPEIRQYLTSAYSDDELGMLCADYFRDVYEDFAAGMTKAQKIGLLLDYCQRRDQLPNLLAALERNRPQQYRARFAGNVIEARPAAPQPQRDPRQVFISHVHEDAEFAHRLASDLERNGWRVWIAPDSIRPGEKWAEAINRGLEESGVFIVALTPAAVASNWVKIETNLAIELVQGGEARFFPLLVSECRPPVLWTAFQRILFSGRYPAGLADLLAALDQKAIKPQEIVPTQPPVVPTPAPKPQPEPTVPPPEHQAKPQLRLEWLWPAVGGLVAMIVTVLIVTRGSSMKLTPTPTGSGVAVALATVTSETPASLLAATPLPVPTLGIGSTTVSEQDGMTLVYVRAGEFLMGSADSDPDARSDEKPQHQVTLDAYWIDQTEVTNAMFAKFVAASGYKTDAEKSGKAWVFNTTSKQWEEMAGADWEHPRGPGSDLAALERHPVVQVSWNDAAAYCAWAGRRLPTEAEWEKAARRTDGRKFPWGNQNVAGDLLNFADRNLDADWADKNIDDGYQFTAPVGSYLRGASPYDALDMAGNVWEWVGNWYDEKYYPSSPAQNPKGPDAGQARVLRGGSWNNGQGNVRAAVRIRFGPDSRYGSVGFRCARSP